MSKAQRSTPVTQIPFPPALLTLIDKVREKHPGVYGSRSDFVRRACFALCQQKLAEQPAATFEQQIASALDEFRN